MKLLVLSLLTFTSALAFANCNSETAEISQKLRAQVEVKCDGVELENGNIFYKLTNRQRIKCLNAKESLNRVTVVGNALLGYPDALQAVTHITVAASYNRKMNHVYGSTSIDGNGRPQNRPGQNTSQAQLLIQEADVESALKRYSSDSAGCTELLEGFSSHYSLFLDNFYDMAEKSAHQRLGDRKGIL